MRERSSLRYLVSRLGCLVGYGVKPLLHPLKNLHRADAVAAQQLHDLLDVCVHHPGVAARRFSSLAHNSIESLQVSPASLRKLIEVHAVLIQALTQVGDGILQVDECLIPGHGGVDDFLELLCRLIGLLAHLIHLVSGVCRVAFQALQGLRCQVGLVAHTIKGFVRIVVDLLQRLDDRFAVDEVDLAGGHHLLDLGFERVDVLARLLGAALDVVG